MRFHSHARPKFAGALPYGLATYILEAMFALDFGDEYPAQAKFYAEEPPFVDPFDFCPAEHEAERIAVGWVEIDTSVEDEEPSTPLTPERARYIGRIARMSVRMSLIELSLNENKGMSIDTYHDLVRQRHDIRQRLISMGVLHSTPTMNVFSI